MIIKLKKYEYVTRSWVPTVPAKFMSTSARILKGYNIDKHYFKYPYGHGDTVAPTCLAKWVN